MTTVAEVLSTYAQKLNQEDMPAGKKKVLLAALDLFANNGFNGTTTAGIAKKAGVSEGTIYKYFSSKRNLLVQLLSPILENIKSSFFVKLDFGTSLNDFLTFVIKNRVHFLSENLDLVKIIMQEALTDSSTLQSFNSVMKGNNGLIVQMENIKTHFSEINPKLKPDQMLRIIAGPIFVYVLQREIMHKAPIKKLPASELTIIKDQITAGLTK